MVWGVSTGQHGSQKDGVLELWRNMLRASVPFMLSQSGLRIFMELSSRTRNAAQNVTEWEAQVGEQLDCTGSRLAIPRRSSRAYALATAFAADDAGLRHGLLAG